MKERWNVGDIDEVTADEDTDRDVEIAEGPLLPTVGSARRRLEERRERFVDDEVFA